MNEVYITHLRCLNGCGGPLIITDEDLAECEYCGNRYRITGWVEEIRDYWEGPFDPYFLDPDRCCFECFHFRRGWCGYWNMKARPDQLCDHFEENSDYFCKGGVGTTYYPHDTVYPSYEKCSPDCKFYRNIFGVERCKHPNIVFVATGIRCAKFERRK